MSTQLRMRRNDCEELGSKRCPKACLTMPIWVLLPLRAATFPFQVTADSYFVDSRWKNTVLNQKAENTQKSGSYAYPLVSWVIVNHSESSTLRQVERPYAGPQRQ